MKKYKLPEQTQFVPTGKFVETIFQGGSYSLSLGYTDHAGVIKDKDYPNGQRGRYVEYVQAKEANGRDKAKRFKFDQSLGRIMTRPSDTDIYGRSQYEFLKNHPECEGSPNGIYEEAGQVGVSFRELNTAKDAAIAVQSDRLRNKAEATAFNLDDQTLEEVANIIGYFGEVDDMMLLKVVEFARKQPGEFDNLIKSEDRGVRAVIRKALAEGLFKQFGKDGLIKWETTVIGNDENDAVATLRKDKAMLVALQEKLGIDAAEVKSKAKKPAVVTI